MSATIIGIEGRISDDSVVVWGAAAIATDGEIRNSVTDRSVTRANASRLSEERQLYLLPKPIKITAEHAPSPLILVMVRLASAFHQLFLADTGKVTGLAKSRKSGDWHYYVFEERQSFDAYARHVAQRVMSNILYTPDIRAEVSIERHRSVIRNALSLIPTDPDLNALRAYLTPTAVVERICRSSLRGDVAIHRFETLFTAFIRSDEGQYEIKYDQGAARGGGLDVDIAAGTLQAVSRASKLLQFPVRQDYPYLRSVPPPRLREMLAASAHLNFVPRTDASDLLGDRVARYLELQLLEKALEGAVELPDAENQRQLDGAVQKILTPSPDTIVQHKRLTEVEYTDVRASEVVAPEPIFSERMDLIGVVSGLARDSLAELQFSPELRVFVSSEDDGEGSSPAGAEMLDGDGRFLRRPCVISVVREHVPGGIPKFHLRQLRLLNRAEETIITALPSAVVEDAFLVGRRITLNWSTNADRLTGDLGTFEGIGAGTREAATSFMEQLLSATLEYELANFENARWIAPPKQKEAPSLARVLAALAHLGGSGKVFSIRSIIEKRFDVSMRANNTRREVDDHPDFLRYEEEDNQTVQWTDRGRRFYGAYVKAGGTTQKLD